MKCFLSVLVGRLVHVVDRGLLIAINKKALKFSNLKAGPHCLQCCVLHEERNIVERDFVERDFVATSSTVHTGNIVFQSFYIIAKS